MKLCPGCQTKIPDSERRCAECRKSSAAPSPGPGRQHTYADGINLRHLYQSPAWTKLSRVQLARFPICEMCHITKAVISDHFIPAGIFIALCMDLLDENGRKRFASPERAFYYMGNLQSLCRSCHWRKTEADKQHIGPWPDLFANPRRAPKKWSF